jgi:hypothetical protein
MSIPPSRIVGRTLRTAAKGSNTEYTGDERSSRPSAFGVVSRMLRNGRRRDAVVGERRAVRVQETSVPEEHPLKYK